jgi:putative nucleotidyltransferase with HDIG domain
MDTRRAAKDLQAPDPQIERHGLRTSIYVVALSVIAGCVATLAFTSSESTPPVGALALLILTSVIAERQSVKLAPSIEISVAFFPILFTAVLYGGFWAGLVGAAGLVYPISKPYLRWTCWISARLLVATVAGEIAHLSRYSDTRSLASLTFSAVIAVLVYVSLDMTVAAATLTVRKTAKAAELIRMTIVIDAVSVLLYSPIIAVLAYAYLEAPKWTLILFIAPVLATQRLFILYREQRETAANLTAAVAKLERVNLSFATALVTALDARDHYTAGHSATVAVYAHDIAKQLELTEDTQRRAHLCGLLHDIGKIGVPTGVLEKEGPLKRVERQAIENHAEIGAAILGRIEGYEELAAAVRHHHERFDGTGYPDRQGGDGIPLLARLVAVADAYSAMTSDRPYRTALYGKEARERLERGTGKQFDPEVVKAFVDVLGRESESYAAGNDRDFEVEISKLTAQDLERAPALASGGSLV